MPKLQNAEFVNFDPTVTPPLRRAIGILLGSTIPAYTGLKVRRIVRELDKLAEDVAAERKRLLDIHAEKGDDGEFRVLDGRYVLRDEPEFNRQFEELIRAEVEIKEALTPRDLIRKERDTAGKVYEVDDYPGELYLLLGNLLTEDTDGEG